MEENMNRKPTHPGEILKELYLVPLNIGVGTFAKSIGISRKTISAVINGHRRVTPDLAVRFAAALPSTNPQMWLNLQNAVDIYEAESVFIPDSISPIIPIPVPV